ncbi:MAG: hypothetical protein ACYTFZ_08020, partial [Planctomycetota bacterium]
MTQVDTGEEASWSIADGLLTARMPADFKGRSLAVVCRLRGAAAATDDGYLLDVPLFTSPQAERHEGRVLLRADGHELSFAELASAVQTAVEGRRWQLSCDFRAPDAKVAVRIIPIEVPIRAEVQSHYYVSAFRVTGVHRVTVGDTLSELAAVEIVLPPGHVAKQVTSRIPLEWWQDGARLHVRPAAPAGRRLHIKLATDWVMGREQRIRLAPPVVQDVSSSEHAMGISFHPDIQVRTTGRAEEQRVRPESLPKWLKSKSPALGYRSRDAAVPVELEILRIEPEIRGSVQDHVGLTEERIARQTLFLLEVSKRALQELAVAVPPGWTVERVDGPLIESWDLTEDGGLVVRFAQPIEGGYHFQVISSRPLSPGPITLHGLRLRPAPHLKGWLGISADVSVAVRPMEDGQTNLRSARTDRAPEYLQAFDNKLLYELYDSRWELDLLTELIPAVYTAEVLNVLGFRAAQADASALFRINVQRGGVGALAFELPENAAGPQFRGEEVVSSRVEDGVLHVRLRGKRTGTFACRLDYNVLTGTGSASLEIKPVRLVGAREQTGILLLTQARPDAEVKPGPLPRALMPAEPEEHYPAWSYRREHPALAAYAYHGPDWSLPVTVVAHPLSEIMLAARIPLAKLETLVQSGEESIHHLRLYVSNTNRQFLTLDLARLGPEARLIGTFADGQPVKPFREGETNIQLPLFTSEKAVRIGMSVLDITYATAHRGLAAVRRQSLAAPDLGLNVGQLEWTVRMPEGCRIAGIGGNMGKPVGELPEADSLAVKLLTPVAQFLREYWGLLVALAVFAVVVAAAWLLIRLMMRHPAVARKLVPRPLLTVALVIVIAVILAAMFMPALGRARREAYRTNQRANIHNVGLGISMYRGYHDGAAPSSLSDLLDEGYLDDPALLESMYPEQKLIYRPRRPKAHAGEVIAYYWPPTEGANGVNVLFNDMAVMWVPLEEDGALRNPRIDEGVIARAAPRAEVLRT